MFIFPLTSGPSVYLYKVILHNEDRKALLAVRHRNSLHRLHDDTLWFSLRQDWYQGSKIPYRLGTTFFWFEVTVRNSVTLPNLWCHLWSVCYRWTFKSDHRALFRTSSDWGVGGRTSCSRMGSLSPSVACQNFIAWFLAEITEEEHQVYNTQMLWVSRGPTGRPN